MIENKSVAEILSNIGTVPLLDVRTPKEFQEGHIPGALNMPLFNNDQRIEVGTVYKKQGPDEALKLGLDFVGPKMRTFIEQATGHAKHGKIAVHCWRGGKRSGSIAWLLNFAGLEVHVMHGGYKAYRNHLLSTLEETQYNLMILGGRTGSRKTAVLHELQKRDVQVLDLEGLARHKGSAFGWIGEPDQPYTQQFENDVFAVLETFDSSRTIWVENESKSIGRVYVPDAFWIQMKEAPLVHLDVPLSIRIQHLVDLYSNGDNIKDLVLSFEKIAKRLGGQHLNSAKAALDQGDLALAAEIALVYYDKAYDYNLSVNKSPAIQILEASSEDISETADQLLDKLRQV